MFLSFYCTKNWSTFNFNGNNWNRASSLLGIKCIPPLFKLNMNAKTLQYFHFLLDMLPRGD